MNDTLMATLTVVGMFQIFYVIHLMNRIIRGLDMMKARLDVFAQEHNAGLDPASHLQARLLQEIRNPGRPRG